jgi:Domain of unknown function (DUF4158)
VYGRYAAKRPSREVLDRFFFLDDADRELAAKHRGDHNRLGFSVQLVTVRHVGRFLPDPLDVAGVVAGYVAEQIGVADPHPLLRRRPHQRSRAPGRRRRAPLSPQRRPAHLWQGRQRSATSPSTPNSGPGIAAARRRPADGTMLPSKEHIGRPRTVGPAELRQLQRMTGGGATVTHAARILSLKSPAPPPAPRLRSHPRCLATVTSAG